MTIIARGTASIPGVGSADYALNSLSFHVDGESNQLSSGPAGQTYTILKLPRACGTVSGTSRFTSEAVPALTVAIPQSLSITGCPTAALAPHTVSGSNVALDGSSSSTPVAGRTIAKWHWGFGDGTTAVTSSPTVSHGYANPGVDHTVSLFVEDSAGAVSPSVTQVVTAFRHTLSVAKAGAGSGAVTSSPAGIDCGAACSSPFDAGSSVTLTATPAAGSVFSGFSGGGCSGTGACHVTLNVDQKVTATFAPSNHFKVGKPTLNKKTGTAKLSVKVPGPGRLALNGKGIRKRKRSASRAGMVALLVKATGKAKQELDGTGTATVKAKVTYTPTGGTSNKVSRRIKLVEST